MKRIVIIFLLAAGVFSCKEGQKQESEEWIYLFDGTSVEGWRAYNGDALPPGWVAKDGELTFDTELGLEQDYKGGKDIIYGAEEFENFELSLDWKLPEGGNSGIFYHLKEGYDSPTGICPEYQLIDDINYARIHDLTEYNTGLGYENPEMLHPLQKTAADYAMYPADESQKLLNPAGEWNNSKIIFKPEKVEYWLNGKKVVSFVPWSEDWYERKSVGKWKDSPDYGRFKKGYVGLQDHASPIWFRNIKIKKL
jgi:hypothetical protein